MAEDYLKRLRQEVLDEDLRVRTTVRNGVPFQEITRAATSLGADMIILTTHGYTGLKHVVLGSTAERVVRHADCPVLVCVKRHGATDGLLSSERAELGVQPVSLQFSLRSVAQTTGLLRPVTGPTKRSRGRVSDGGEIGLQQMTHQ